MKTLKMKICLDGGAETYRHVTVIDEKGNEFEVDGLDEIYHRAWLAEKDDNFKVDIRKPNKTLRYIDDCNRYIGPDGKEYFGGKSKMDESISFIYRNKTIITLKWPFKIKGLFRKWLDRLKIKKGNNNASLS